MKSNLFFIIGIRRSGTSILRELIMKHPQIAGCEFEPHDLWAAVDLNHFGRLKKKMEVSTFVNDTIRNFNINGNHAASHNQWYGAKFALNPGVKALEWVWLKKTFPEAKFIFIVRDMNSTWRSYFKQDKNSTRGVIKVDTYCGGFRDVIDTFKKNQDGDNCLQYEYLINHPNEAMNLMFKHLDLPTPNINFKQFIKQPEF